MTQTFATDLSNDLVIAQDGALAIATGVDAVGFACRSTARVLRNEKVLAYAQGIPFRTTAWAGVPNVPAFEAALRQRLLAVPDVTGIVSLTSSRVGNRLGYVATIATVYGNLTLNG
jgi:hypothetical protein